MQSRGCLQLLQVLSVLLLAALLICTACLTGSARLICTAGVTGIADMTCTAGLTSADGLNAAADQVALVLSCCCCCCCYFLLLLQTGFGDYQVSQWNGRRADAFATHLKPALGRANLTVVTNARTTKLATESGSSGARTVGVEYAVGGRSGTKQTGR